MAVGDRVKGDSMANYERDEQRNEGKQPEDEIKVTDRRLFTLAGDLRGDVPGPEEEEPSEQEASAEPSTPSAAGRSTGQERPGWGFERRSLDEPAGVDFTMLINAMAQPALIFLGEIPHPGTGQPEVNLDQARMQIDLLDVLRIKCRGNLTSEEEALLDRILYQLRMLFVARSGERPPS